MVYQRVDERRDGVLLRHNRGGDTELRGVVVPHRARDGGLHIAAAQRGAIEAEMPGLARAPLGDVSNTPLMSAIDRNFPAVLPTISRSSDVMRPAARSWFSLRSALITWETDNP